MTRLFFLQINVKTVLRRRSTRRTLRSYTADLSAWINEKYHFISQYQSVTSNKFVFLSFDSSLVRSTKVTMI